MLSREIVGELGDAIDRLIAAGDRGFDAAGSGRGRFFNDLFTSLEDQDFAAFVRKSRLARLAGKIMGAQHVRFFYDQLLVKEPGTAARTAWHQDLSYWPVKGQQIVSIWVPVDCAGPDNGVVTYVRGSHNRGSMFPMQPFTDDDVLTERAPPQFEVHTDDPTHDVYDRSNLLSEIRQHPEKFEMLTWEVEPGDVIVHHPLVIHGAPGNTSTDRRRRALATRWLGDDAVWDDTRPNFMRMMKGKPGFPYPRLENGASVDHPLFPLLWSAEEGALDDA
ncbi:hypothetical protein ASE85_10905 [Sphingobium sp. Leaf26]|nr:hypothetical protein ASE85_10905 [Sphingobium sp. Leaf26]